LLLGMHYWDQFTAKCNHHSTGRWHATNQLRSSKTKWLGTCSCLKSSSAPWACCSTVCWCSVSTGTTRWTRTCAWSWCAVRFPAAWPVAWPWWRHRSIWCAISRMWWRMRVQWPTMDWRAGWRCRWLGTLTE